MDCRSILMHGVFVVADSLSKASHEHGEATRLGGQPGPS